MSNQFSLFPSSLQTLLSVSTYHLSLWDPWWDEGFLAPRVFILSVPVDLQQKPALPAGLWMKELNNIDFFSLSLLLLPFFICSPLALPDRSLLCSNPSLLITLEAALSCVTAVAQPGVSGRKCQAGRTHATGRARYPTESISPRKARPVLLNPATSTPQVNRARGETCFTEHSLDWQ